MTTVAEVETVPDSLEDVRHQCTAVGEPDPADEATLLALKHRGLEGARLWVNGSKGFALVRDGSLTLAVAPGDRGHGVGRTLAKAAMAAEPRSAWSHADHPSARSLATRFGFKPTRSLLVLRRASTPLPPLRVPSQITIRAYDPSDRDAVLAVNAAAFADHPEQGAMDAADFAQRTGEDWFDPAGLLVAVDADGAVLGFHWTKQHSAETGEVYVIGIAPQAQGRGLGKALTLAGLEHLDAQGVDEVILYVESDNAPALSVYTGLGFTPARTHVLYARP